MAGKAGYGQYCPIAVTAEIVAERWTPLVLRGLCMGATRFNELQDSVPRMSPSLLATRLRALERAGVVSRIPSETGRGSDYRLTEAGAELFPVLESMGFWSQKWLRREIVRDENLDPDILMWELRRARRAADDLSVTRRVVQFRIAGVPNSRRFYWLVFEGREIDVCAKDPGHEVDLWVTAHIRTLVEVWLGHRPLRRALEEGTLELHGARGERERFAAWFTLSHFAAAPGVQAP